MEKKDILPINNSHEPVKYSGIDAESADILQLIDDFAKRYHLIRQKLPYHINVIDELHVNENANSRILASLLLYEINGDYSLLKSFIEYCLRDWNINVSKPQVSTEQMRIDLLVKEKGKYAIIFENKIYEAIMQKNQIARYIQKLRQEGYKDEQIYVVFLPPNYYEPNICSWHEPKRCCNSCERVECSINSAPKLREEFRERFKVVTFRENIISWLKEDVIPNCKQEEVFLYTAATQYLDYLEGYFDIRSINKKMNMELKQFLTERFNLNDISAEEKLKILEEKTEEITRLLNQVNAFKDSVRKELAITDVEKWKPYIEKIQKILPSIAEDLQLNADCGFFDSTKSSHFYIKFHKDEWQQLSIVIEKYGIGVPDQKIGDEVFVYVGKCGEQTVDDAFLNAKKRIFKEKSWKGSPYGWEHVDKYHKKLDCLIADIDRDEFKDYIKNTVKDVLSKIEEENLPM